MSRIIVKQLPKNITEEKLRNIFGTKGTITDLQLKYTPEGKFRQFCFIGYQKEEEAQAAIEFYNNTCIQTSRIKVELCAALGSDDKPQVWSKYASEAERKPKSIRKKEEQLKALEETKNKKNSKVDEILQKHKDDPAFKEFLKAHDKNRTLWENDADVGNETAEKNNDDEEDKDSGTEIGDNGSDEENSDSATEGQEEKEPEKIAEKSISDLEYMKSLMAKAATTNKEVKTKSKKSKTNLELYTIKIRNIPYSTKRQDIIKFFKPLKPFSVRLPSKSNGFCYVGFKNEKDMAKAMLKHKSFIKGAQVFLTDFTDKNKITKEAKQKETETGKSLNPKWAKQAESLHNEENIGESGSIFFRNLAYTVTEDDLQKLFEKFGPVTEINLPVDKLTRQIKGFGTVVFLMPEHALQAFNKLDGTDFHGRLLHLLPGKSKDDQKEKPDENDDGLTFKQKKALKLKKSAQQPTSWNTLFLGPNAVAEILANRFETTKEKILDTGDGGSSAAVRIALGETQIVIEMKKFLEEQGVYLNAFDEPTPSTKRSKTIILAKNLPANTSVSELTPIFAKFGPIGRLVLPPSGVTALIEFCDASEARKAFKNLAYSKFKNLPLYLEWAPENSFTKDLSGEPMIAKIEEPAKDENVKDEGEQTEKSKQNDCEANDNIDDEDKDMEPEPNTTLFLRNLNFKTVKETVCEHFRHLGTIHTVEIAKRKDAENPKKLVSLGYGFIQFKRAATAEKALKNMQFTTIDGNGVELKRSDRILKTAVNAQRRNVSVKATQQTGSKILVRNLPFQAKEKEIREIFKAFGELRSVRLPKKNVPGEEEHIRGFGFVDYLTKSDAKKAFAALSQSTHLYGRRLVLEWAANDEEDVNELRKRTADQVQQSNINRNVGKRKKFDIEDDGNNDNEED